MRKSLSRALAALIAISTSATAAVTINDEQVEVVDIHLHTGTFGALNPEGKAFIIDAIPAFSRLYYPAVAQLSTSAYAENLGVKAQTEMAGVDQAVLLAVYTHHTSGYFTNRQLEETLVDARNVSPDDDGTPWAWGMVSITFDDFEGETRTSRLDALASYFEHRPDLFIGIKLAHAHQAVAFDDEAYLGVYEVAATYGAPVLLHTGFSPFPNSKITPEYYDPLGLEQVIEAYDGVGDKPRVDFVLSHVGQGDRRATINALELAERHDNVWLEVSALGRPLLIDENGEEVESTEDQLPWVIEQIYQRGLVGQTLYGSDGPQSSGMGVRYLGEVIEAMQAAAFDTADMRAVLSGNFYALYR